MHRNFFRERTIYPYPDTGYLYIFYTDKLLLPIVVAEILAHAGVYYDHRSLGILCLSMTRFKGVVFNVILG